MAHEMEINPVTGEAMGIFGRDISAWHRLGHNVSGTFTAKEGMDIAGLSGWNVRKLPIYHMGDDPTLGEAHEIEGQYVTVRDNPFVEPVLNECEHFMPSDLCAVCETTYSPGQIDTLGIVGEVYHPFQNEESAEFLDMLAGEAGAHWDTMGSIRRGTQTFMSMALPAHLMVGGVDRQDLNLTILNSHDGSLQITPMVTAVRVVCANTFDWAIRNNVAFASLRHTNGAKARINEVREALGVTFSAKDEFAAEAERMIQAEMTKGQFEKKMFGPTGVYSTIAPKVTAGTSAKNNWAATRDGLMDYFTGDIEKDKENDTKIGGTAWGAFQAVTWMEDHKRNIRSGASDTEGRQRDRAERAVSGIGSNLKNKAWTALRVPEKKVLVSA